MCNSSTTKNDITTRVPWKANPFRLNSLVSDKVLLRSAGPEKALNNPGSDKLHLLKQL